MHPLDGQLQLQSTRQASAHECASCPEKYEGSKIYNYVLCQYELHTRGDAARPCRMTKDTCLGARKANMKAYVVVIASTKTRQSKMDCMLRGESETVSCLLYWKKMMVIHNSLSKYIIMYVYVHISHYSHTYLYA
jgi:hypothetical protein